MPYLVTLRQQTFPPATLRDGRKLSDPVRRLIPGEPMRFEYVHPVVLGDPMFEVVQIADREEAPAHVESHREEHQRKRRGR